MTESCREWRGDLAAHAIGRLEPERDAAVNAHLDGCRACRAELGELRLVARALPATDARDLTPPNDPPTGLRDRVLDQLAWARAGERSRRRRRLSVVIGTIVAAAAALVGVLALGASLHGPSSDTKQVAFTVA